MKHIDLTIESYKTMIVGFLRFLSPCFNLFFCLGFLVCFGCNYMFNILRFDRDAYNALNGKVEEGEKVADDEDVEEAFEVVAEVSEDVSLKSVLPP